MNDMYLVRSGKPDGKVDLAVGQPYFLENLPFTQFPNHKTYNLKYPIFGGETPLVEEILNFHGGAYKYAVVANGGKQALLAAFFAYGRYFLSHRAPYWPSYPTLAKLAGSNFLPYTEKVGSGTLLVNTSPNNPDGSQDDQPCHILDAAYNHNMYGATTLPPHEVSVWSASKLLGLSGARVGWLCTNNEEIARKAGQYVEITTSGVCVDAQLQVSGVLSHLNVADTSSHYSNARSVLLRNGELFTRYLSDYVLEYEGVPKTGTGMFAWFKVKDLAKFNLALERAGVKMLPGEACGGGRDWFRMSCGHRNQVTEDALRKLQRELLHA